eukprot:2438208-Pyramimonas_sp.AAC.1
MRAVWAAHGKDQVDMMLCFYLVMNYGLRLGVRNCWALTMPKGMLKFRPSYTVRAHVYARPVRGSPSLGGACSCFTSSPPSI